MNCPSGRSLPAASPGGHGGALDAAQFSLEISEVAAIETDPSSKNVDAIDTDSVQRSAVKLPPSSKIGESRRPFGNVMLKPDSSQYDHGEEVDADADRSERHASSWAPLKAPSSGTQQCNSPGSWHHRSRSSYNSREGSRGSLRLRDCRRSRRQRRSFVRPHTTESESCASSAKFAKQPDVVTNFRSFVHQRPFTVPAARSENFVQELLPAGSDLNRHAGQDKRQGDARILGSDIEPSESVSVAVVALPSQSDVLVQSLDPLIEDERTKEVSSEKTSLASSVCIHNKFHRVPRLCGRCGPTRPNVSLITYPSRRVHDDLRASYHRCKQEATYPRTDLAPVDISELPALPMPSVFSQKQYRDMAMLSEHDVFRLECSILQHKVKEPWMRKEALAQCNAEGMFDMREARRREFEMANIRKIIKKPYLGRNASDRRTMLDFLRKQPFFKDHKAHVVSDIAKNLLYRRFEAQEYLYKRGDCVTDVYILLDGEVSIDGQRESLKTKPGSPRQNKRESMFQRTSQGCLDPDAWKTRQPKLASLVSAKESPYGASIIGLCDVFVEGQLPPQSYIDPRYSHSPKALSVVDVIAIPARRIASLLEADAIESRMTVLQEVFPATKGKTVDELLKPSKVVHNGHSMALHELFELTDVKMNTSFHLQGEKYPLEEANIVMIVEGEAQLKSRGVVIDVIQAGGMLGEEALHGDYYDYTASIRSEGARILSIAADDYVREFQGGRLKKSRHKALQKAKNQEKPKTGVETVVVLKAVQKASKTFKAQISPQMEVQAMDGDAVLERSLCDTFGSSAAMTLLPVRATAKSPWKDMKPRRGDDQERIAMDHRNVMELEWKRIALKKLPERVAPPSKHSSKALRSCLGDTDEFNLASSKVSTGGMSASRSTRRTAVCAEAVQLFAQDLTASSTSSQRKAANERDDVAVHLVSGASPGSVPALLYGVADIVLPRIPPFVLGLKSRQITKQRHPREGSSSIVLPKLL